MPQKVVIDKRGATIVEQTEHQHRCEWLGLPENTDEDTINEKWEAAILKRLKEREQEDKKEQARQRVAEFDTKEIERDLSANPNTETIIAALTKALQVIGDMKS
jgi:hypothetical protein